MTAVDLLLNGPSFITTAGGTTTPASGTVETWASSTLTAFTGITTGTTECRVQDLAAPGEIILVTNVAGTAVTVTRGAEGTTPVAHAVGHSFTAVLTAGGIVSYVAGAIVTAMANVVVNGNGTGQIELFEGTSDPGGAAAEGALWVDA